MKTIEIVTHCYAERLPHYADALVYQLSSLVLHRPSNDVMVTVCTTPDDKRTNDAAWFAYLNSVDVRPLFLTPPQLFRRAIGRNLAAKQTEADIVWFTDADIAFGQGCIDALAGVDWKDDVSIVYPPDTWISRDHAMGDRTLAQVGGEPQLIDVDPTEFVPKQYNNPIGPIQIVQGNFARKYGYLDGHPKWQRPVTDGKFARCSADPVFRRFCKRHGRVMKVDLPNVFRIRHSEAASPGHKVP